MKEHNTINLKTCLDMVCPSLPCLSPTPSRVSTNTGYVVMRKLCVDFCLSGRSHVKGGRVHTGAGASLCCQGSRPLRDHVLSLSLGTTGHTLSYNPGESSPLSGQSSTVDSALVLPECVQHHDGDHHTAGCAGPHTCSRGTSWRPSGTRKIHLTPNK